MIKSVNFRPFINLLLSLSVHFINCGVFCSSMKDKIVVVDFGGTLIKASVLEEANKRRLALLGLSAPSDSVHKQQHGSKSHYDEVRSRIALVYGVSDAVSIRYVQNRGKEMTLSGKDVQTLIMTDLFRDCMYAVAKERGANVFQDGFVAALQKIQKNGFKLAIASGMRTDIISGVLAIAQCPVAFDFIAGHDPVLSRDDNAFLQKEIAKKGKIEYVIGDKASDLEPARQFKAKSVFVTWGHSTGGEEKLADFVVRSADELPTIVK
jgi:phosphoglycolate phosphatase-like HAD superfamily hydrolase